MPLRTVQELPPGGWIYVQKNAQGLDMTPFRDMGGFNAFCEEIVRVRKANSLPGADLKTVAADVEAFTCQRLGNDPRFCLDGSGPVVVGKSSFYATAGPGCGFCGGKKA